MAYTLPPDAVPVLGVMSREVVLRCGGESV
jgi:hypothetical protein